MIKRIKFSQSVRVGTKEVTFIDVDKLPFKIEEYNGKITIIEEKTPQVETVTTMANVVYYEMERVDARGADNQGVSEEIRESDSDDDRPSVSKTSRRNKR